MSFDKNNFENLRFDPFGCDNVLLNNTNNPDGKTFNNLSQVDSVLYAVEEAATSFKKVSDKTFSGPGRELGSHGNHGKSS